jgi:hypothetical protein
MNMLDVDTEQLIIAYREAAKRHGEATTQGDHKAANESAELIAAIYSEIKRRGLDAKRQLLPLLHDLIPAVRLWAASHALEFSPNEGEITLEQISKNQGFLAFDAKMTLKEWRAGRLRFP